MPVKEFFGNTEHYFLYCYAHASIQKNFLLAIGDIVQSANYELLMVAAVIIIDSDKSKGDRDVKTDSNRFIGSRCK